MIKEIKHKILQVSESTGIEITLLANEGISINGVSLKLEKNKIVKRVEFHSIGSYTELLDKISIVPPISVVINGKGVLQKTISHDAISENPFDNILPNANPNEFYVQVTRFENIASVCIIRRELAEKIIQHLKSLKFKILSVSIGTSDIRYIEPYLNLGKEPVVRSNNFNIFFDEMGRVSDIEALQNNTIETNEKFEYNIGDQYVFSPAILSFGAASNIIANGLHIPTEIENSTISKDRDEYVWFKYFGAAKWAFLIMVFFILLVNFFVYNYYFRKNSEKQAAIAISQGQQKLAEKLQAEIDSKEKFVEFNGWGNSSRLSFFADRIAGLVPSSALLTSMKLYPIKTVSFGENNLPSFKNDTIQLMGTCDDPTELNRFCNNLKNIQELKEATIKSYLYKKEIQSGTFLMEIIAK